MDLYVKNVLKNYYYKLTSPIIIGEMIFVG